MNNRLLSQDYIELTFTN